MATWGPSKCPIDVLVNALFLSEFPELKLKIFNRNTSSKQAHCPPFDARLRCAGYIMKAEALECERAELRGILCDLMLSHVYQGEHMLGTGALQHRWSVQFEDDKRFTNEQRFYRQRLSKIFPNRRKRQEPCAADVDPTPCTTSEAKRFRDISKGIPPDTDWSMILDHLLKMHNFLADWSINPDIPSSETVKVLKCQFTVYNRDNFGHQKQLVTYQGEQVREVYGLDPHELKNEMSRRVIELMERHGLIPEVDYRNWNEMSMKMLTHKWKEELSKQKEFNKQWQTLDPRESKSKAKKSTSEAQAWECVQEFDTSDEEWNDDEAFEWGPGGSDVKFTNYFVHFRRWYNGIYPKAKELPEPQQPNYKALPPYLIPGAYLDFENWRQFGFDGQRTQPIFNENETTGDNVEQSVDSIYTATPTILQPTVKTNRNVNFEIDYSRNKETFDQEQAELQRIQAWHDREARKRKILTDDAIRDRHARNLKRNTSMGKRGEHLTTTVWKACFPRQRMTYVKKYYKGPEINIDRDAAFGPSCQGPLDTEL